MFRNLVRVLRSRRLAAGLIIALAAYIIVATLVPRGAPSDRAILEWAAAHPVAESVAGPVGMHRGYTSPAFVALLLTLALSISACAVERTRYAVLLLRRARHGSSAAEERIRSRPQSVYPLRDGVEPCAGLQDVADGLGRLRLRVDVEGPVLRARAGIVGPFSSAVFHWSILALMLVAAAGQATRAEGSMALPVGQRVKDVRSNYLQASEGPLFGGRYTGMELSASDLVRHHVVGGVDHGAAPVVTVFEDGARVASGRIYPNSPLKAGPLLINNFESDFGPAVTVALDHGPVGGIERGVLMFIRSADTSSGTLPRTISSDPGQAAARVDVRMQVIVMRSPRAGADRSQPSRAVVETSVAGAGRFGPLRTLRVGESMELAPGVVLRLLRVSDWVQIRVVNDWSVPALYAMLGVAIVALGVAVLVPVRRVVAVMVETGGGWSLHAETWHSGRDPLFRGRVEDVVRTLVGETERHDPER